MFEMSYVSDVAYIAYLVAKVGEQLDENVICHSRSCMAEMCISIYGRAAHIKAYMSFIERLE